MLDAGTAKLGWGDTPAEVSSAPESRHRSGVRWHHCAAQQAAICDCRGSPSYLELQYIYTQPGPAETLQSARVSGQERHLCVSRYHLDGYPYSPTPLTF